jgi:hypothetical protein
VQRIQLPVLAPLAFSAVRAADVIISCVDDDGARLVAALIAASHLRIHLDIGVQVSAGDDGRRSAGADVRLIMPEAPTACLACFGGFAQPEGLRRMAGFDRSTPREWNLQRAGSLRTVNQIAAHLGLRMIEQLVSGELTTSSWLRYEEGPRPAVREIVPRRPWHCPVCGDCFGIGDAVLQDLDLRLRRIVRAIADAGAPVELKSDREAGS